VSWGALSEFVPLYPLYALLFLDTGPVDGGDIGPVRGLVDGQLGRWPGRWALGGAAATALLVLAVVALGRGDQLPVAAAGSGGPPDSTVRRGSSGCTSGPIARA
jgi:hypothetical protein